MDKYVVRSPVIPPRPTTSSSSTTTTTITTPKTTPTTTTINNNNISPASINSFFTKSPSSQTPANPGPCIGFDRYAGKRWIYPNNMTIRGYQKKAVETALFANSMIVLPTGFGKTFIAAVVMYNFHRWYPTGKIIFVAPTKPLVNQQIEECKKISGIPSSDCVEMTGTMHSRKRDLEWSSKRVFFATPQVIENDLKSDILPADQVRCIVIDEAHRAQGEYAYVGIVRRLHEANRNGFRVLALSATPGSDIERVKQVLLNLYIKELVFRSEDSIDLIQYKNQKTTKAWTVALVGKHEEFVERFKRMCDPIVKELYRRGLTYSGDSIDRVAKFTFLSALKRLSSREEGANFGQLNNRLKFCCSVGMTLAQAFELLTLYGIRPFYAMVMFNLKQSRSNMRVALASNTDFDVMLEEIRDMFKSNIGIEPSVTPKVDLLKGHPKLKVVKDLLMKHFELNEGKKETRAMVFTRYRDSVYDIVQSLRSFDPVLKVGAFVGQGANKKQNVDEQSGGGMTQKEQLQMIKDYKEGKFNVLVATCVAEEGLDIGEIDLIICYDTTSSPISNVQRRGRTGRKRSGDVETLLTQGYEEKKLRKAGTSKRQVEDQLFKKENYIETKYRDSPRMVPLDVQPICLEQRIFPVNDVVEDKQPKKKRQKCDTNKEEEEEKKKSDKKDIESIEIH